MIERCPLCRGRGCVPAGQRTYIATCTACRRSVPVSDLRMQCTLMENDMAEGTIAPIDGKQITRNRRTHADIRKELAYKILDTNKIMKKVADDRALQTLVGYALMQVEIEDRDEGRA